MKFAVLNATGQRGSVSIGGSSLAPSCQLKHLTGSLLAPPTHRRLCSSQHTSHMHADPGPVELRAAEKNRIKEQQSEQSAALHYVHIRLTPVCRAISSTRQSHSVTLLHHITARFTCSSRALNRCLQMDLWRPTAGCFTPGGSALMWGGRVKQEDPAASCLERNRSCRVSESESSEFWSHEVGAQSSRCGGVELQREALQAFSQLLLE